MNKRLHKKVMVSLVAKIVAKALCPELYLKATKPEKKLYRTDHARVRFLVEKSYNNLIR